MKELTYTAGFYIMTYDRHFRINDRSVFTMNILFQTLNETFLSISVQLLLRGGVLYFQHRGVQGHRMPNVSGSHTHDKFIFKESIKYCMEGLFYKYSLVIKLGLFDGNTLHGHSEFVFSNFSFH